MHLDMDHHIFEVFKLVLDINNFMFIDVKKCQGDNNWTCLQNKGIFENVNSKSCSPNPIFIQETCF